MNNIDEAVPFGAASTDGRGRVWVDVTGNFAHQLTRMVLGRYTYVLGYIGLVAVGRRWVLAGEKAIFGGPFPDDNGSRLGMPWVGSLAIFISKPAISTLKTC
jgi:hypothetical protein